MMTENEKKRGKWFIGHCKVENFDLKNIDLNNYTAYNAPPNLYAADPFYINYRGQGYVFFENYNYKKGRIAYYKLNDKLQPSSANLIDIDIGSHASYPHLFEDNDKIYMIPETCGLNKINIYEAENFPKKWKFKKTLVNNVHAADSSIIKYNNKYWMFTQINKKNKDYFTIYYSDHLLGEWRQHSLINYNNNLSDKNYIRGAGNIFIKNNKIIRPSQFNKKIYGEGVVLNEINHLSETDYKETPVNIICKETLNTIRCIHTFSVYDNLIIFDAKFKSEIEPEYVKIDIEKEIQLMINHNKYI